MATERERQLLALLQSMSPDVYTSMYDQGLAAQQAEQAPYTGRVLAAGLGGDAIKATDELYQVWEQGYSPEDAARMFATAVSQGDFVVTPEDQQKIVAAFMDDVKSKAKSGSVNTSPIAAFSKMDMPELAALAPALQAEQSFQQAGQVQPSSSTLSWLKELQDKANMDLNAITSGENKRSPGLFEKIASPLLKTAAPIVGGLGAAGLTMLAPFTGGASLAAVPVAAGLAAGAVGAGTSGAVTNALLNWAYGDKDKKWAEENTSRINETLKYVKQEALRQERFNEDAQKIADKLYADYLKKNNLKPLSPFDMGVTSLARSIGG